VRKNETYDIAIVVLIEFADKIDGLVNLLFSVAKLFQLFCRSMPWFALRKQKEIEHPERGKSY
jgi:hypothetical protein